MFEEKLKCLLLADFTIDNFAGLLDNDNENPQVEAVTAPYDQVMPVLLDSNHPIWSRKYDCGIVWTRPQAAVASFAEAISYRPINVESILAEVEQFAAALIEMSHRVRSVFVPQWALGPELRGFGMLEMKPGVGLAHTLMQMNLRLAEKLAGQANIFILDTQRWITLAGRRAFNPKLWYMGKVPFSNEVFAEGVKDIKAALNGLSGGARKLVIVDLDDTLWGGIVGDDGWENLKLGGHDFTGEAFVDFQKALKALTNRGILLGIVSKNTEAVALEAIEKHPEMVLRRDDFAGWRINWNDKAQNVAELTAELNLGLQSVVFIDDNPVERSRIREAFPEVLVPEMPADKMLFPGFLQSLSCFDSPGISEEDLNRSRMYVLERKRKEARQNVSSVTDWLKSLEIKVRVEPLSKTNLERTAQLLNKTNQMNLSTRRLAENELLAWNQHENHRLWTFRVSDKFGDSGLTGIVSVETDNGKAKIVDFILSCRVMGRKVEEMMVSRVFEFAQETGLSEICADYIPTKKNRPCFDFWMSSGFQYDEKHQRFSWSMEKPYPVPSEVQVVVNES